MLNIFKYELQRRKNAIIIFNAIILIMTLIAIILMKALSIDIERLSSEVNIPAYAGIWWTMSMCALVFIPAVMLFTCSSGHVNELLFKDTNYLMLTIPLPSWKIILGRWLAGLIEFLSYFFVSFICTTLWLNFALPFSRFENSLSNLVIKGIFMNIFNNPLFVFVIFIYIITAFTLTGMTIAMVTTLIRSFIKKRGLATALVILLAIFVFSWLNNFATKLSYKLNWIVNFPVTVYNIRGSGTIEAVNSTAKLPMVLPLVWILLAGAFFGIATYLFERKVEV